jgi:hypothetical protein
MSTIPSATTTIPESTKTTTTTTTTEKSVDHAPLVRHEDPSLHLSGTEATSNKSTDAGIGKTVTDTYNNVTSSIANSTVGQQIADVASHMGTALSHGNVTHAVKHASTAAMIGQAEVKKHQQGPMDEPTNPTAVAAAAKATDPAKH